MIDFPASPTEGQIFAPPGAPQYVFTNGAWRMLEGTGLLNFIQQQFITTSGAITLHADTKAFLVEVQGGGAAGGVSQASGATTAAAGAGGGAGGYASKWITRPAGTYNPTCTIGAASGIGAAGNASSFTDGVNTLTANGGALGGTGVPTSNLWRVVGGLGGTATGGTINQQGAKGDDAWEFGTGTAPGVMVAGAGDGANSRFGVGGLGAYAATGGNPNQAGALPLSGYGGGGGGGAAQGGAASAGSFGGTQGCVVITEYR